MCVGIRYEDCVCVCGGVSDEDRVCVCEAEGVRTGSGKE